MTRTQRTCWGLMVLLKSFQRLGYFPKLTEVPDAVTEHIRGRLEVPADVAPEHGTDRTQTRHRMPGYCRFLPYSG